MLEPEEHFDGGLTILRRDVVTWLSQSRRDPWKTYSGWQLRFNYSPENFIHWTRGCTTNALIITHFLIDFFCVRGDKHDKSPQTIFNWFFLTDKLWASSNFLKLNPPSLDLEICQFLLCNFTLTNQLTLIRGRAWWKFMQIP